MRFLSLSCLVVSTLFAAPALADETRGQPANVEEPHTDSALAAGIVDLSIGATLIGFGSLLADEPEQGGVLGAGVGTLAAGIPMLAVGASRVRYPRTSEPAYAAGTSLVSIGGTLSGMGIGWAIGERARSERYQREYGDAYGRENLRAPLVFAGVGAVFGLGGAALMSFGATEMSPGKAAMRDEERREQAAALQRELGPGGTVARSVPRRTVGQVFTIIGATSFTGAAIAGVSLADCSGDLCGFGHFFTTFPLLAHGVITTAIGVPLWVSGAGHVRPEQLAHEEEQPETWYPEVSIGAGSATVTMRY